MENDTEDEHKGIIETITTTMASILGVFARKQIVQVILKIVPIFLDIKNLENHILIYQSIC